MTLHELFKISEDHPYYCATSNFYSNDATGHHATMTDFLDEFEDADVDMNYVFRWDIDFHDGSYSAEVHMIAQRKGIFMPQIIERIEEHEVERFLDYLKRHKDVGDLLWSGI